LPSYSYGTGEFQGGASKRTVEEILTTMRFDRDQLGAEYPYGSVRELPTHLVAAYEAGGWGPHTATKVRKFLSLARTTRSAVESYWSEEMREMISELEDKAFDDMLAFETHKRETERTMRLLEAKESAAKDDVTNATQAREVAAAEIASSHPYLHLVGDRYETHDSHGGPHAAVHAFVTEEVGVAAPPSSTRDGLGWAFLTSKVPIDGVPHHLSHAGEDLYKSIKKRNFLNDRAVILRRQFDNLSKELLELQDAYQHLEHEDERRHQQRWTRYGELCEKARNLGLDASAWVAKPTSTVRANNSTLAMREGGNTDGALVVNPLTGQVSEIDQQRFDRMPDWLPALVGMSRAVDEAWYAAGSVYRRTKAYKPPRHALRDDEGRPDMGIESTKRDIARLQRIVDLTEQSEPLVQKQVDFPALQDARERKLKLAGDADPSDEQLVEATNAVAMLESSVLMGVRSALQLDTMYAHHTKTLAAHKQLLLQKEAARDARDAARDALSKYVMAEKMVWRPQLNLSPARNETVDQNAPNVHWDIFDMYTNVERLHQEQSGVVAQMQWRDSTTHAFTAASLAGYEPQEVPSLYRLQYANASVTADHDDAVKMQYSTDQSGRQITQSANDLLQDDAVFTEQLVRIRKLMQQRIGTNEERRKAGVTLPIDVSFWETSTIDDTWGEYFEFLQNHAPVGAASRELLAMQIVRQQLDTSGVFAGISDDDVFWWLQNNENQTLLQTKMLDTFPNADHPDTMTKSKEAARLIVARNLMISKYAALVSKAETADEPLPEPSWNKRLVEPLDDSKEEEEKLRKALEIAEKQARDRYIKGAKEFARDTEWRAYQAAMEDYNEKYVDWKKACHAPPLFGGQSTDVLENEAGLKELFDGADDVAARPVATALDATQTPSAQHMQDLETRLDMLCKTQPPWFGR